MRGLAAAPSQRVQTAATDVRLAILAQEFMVQHGFNSVEEFRGASLPYFTTHHELVRMQREAVAAKKRARTGLSGDDKWSGDGFVREAESMVAN